MDKRKAFVLTLPSVESLGSIAVISSDKTITLTKNEMTTVKSLITSDDLFSVKGTGYAPMGIFLKIELNPTFNLKQYLILWSDASISAMKRY